MRCSRLGAVLLAVLAGAAAGGAAEPDPPGGGEDPPPRTAEPDPQERRQAERQVEALVLHARVLLDEGRWREAREVLARARRKCLEAGLRGETLEKVAALLDRASAGRRPTPTSPRTADEVTLERLRRMSFAPVLRELEEKHRKDPEDADARWKLAAVRILHGQWEEARTLLAGAAGPALDQDALFARLRERLAGAGAPLRVVLLDLAEGRLEDAQRRLEAALPATPNDEARAKLLAMDLARRLGEPERFRDLAAELARETGPSEAGEELAVTKLVCVRRLWGYGRYEKRPEPFLYAAGASCVLYAELANAGVEEKRDGSFTTDLVVSVRILRAGAAGDVAIPTALAPQRRTDQTRSRPRDVYTYAKFNLPGADVLRPGVYRFSVRVKDVTTDRTAEATAPFTVK